MSDLENVSAGVLYVAHVFARGQNGIGFLDYVVDIDASRCNFGGNQNVFFTCAECCH